MQLTVLLTDAVLAASSGSGDGVHPAFLAFLAGPAFYMFMYRRYRNKDKRHNHEWETPTSTSDVRRSDHFIRRLMGVSNRQMEGANNTDVHGSRVSGRGRNFLKGIFK